MWHQPLNSDIVSQVKLRQATLQFGLWTAADDMKQIFDVCQTDTWHLLQGPLYVARCTVILLVRKWFICVQYRCGSSNPGCWYWGHLQRPSWPPRLSSSHLAIDWWCLRDKCLSREVCVMADNCGEEKTVTDSNTQYGTTQPWYN